MSAHYNIARTTGVTGATNFPVVGYREAVAHPVNCRTECPYGKDKAFCFPCMAKILAERNERKKRG